MNYGARTPELDGPMDRPLDEGIDYDAESPVPMDLRVTRSYTDISKRSLCSARGSYMELRSKTQHLFDITAPTVPEYEMPLHKIRGLRGLYQAALMQTDSSKRNAIQRFLKRESSVYKPKRELTPIRNWSKYTQTTQNKPFKKYFSTCLRREVTLPAIHLHPEVPKRPMVKPPAIIIDVCSPTPSLSPRAKTDTNLLRRPGARSIEPLGMSDPLFEKFTKTIDLKQKKFRSPTDQSTYYEDNYPLLLHAKPEEVSSAKRKRLKAKEAMEAHQIELQRKLKVRNRVSNLHTAIDDLEKETDDIDFRTELRDDVFDPTKFPWNETRYSAEDTEMPHIETSESSGSDSESATSRSSSS